MMRICCVFDIEKAAKAGKALDFEVIERYGDWCNGHPMYCWDDGGRSLVRCKKCGALMLVQRSEYHAFDDDYYTDYFPVADREEALRFNNDYSGFALEEKYPGIYLMETNGKYSWANRKKGKKMKYQELLNLRLDEADADVRFVEAMDAYLDRDYFATLDAYGIDGKSADEISIETLDEKSLLALMTMASRADCFCEGAIADLIENGTLGRCIDRLKVLISCGSDT